MIKVDFKSRHDSDDNKEIFKISATYNNLDDDKKLDVILLLKKWCVTEIKKIN